MNNWQLAKLGETIALNFLLEQGLTLIQKNFRCSLGEIDLILKDGEVFVFCEVKTRTNFKFGDPLESIDQRKLKKLTRLAQYYLVKENITSPFRIDGVGIYIEDTQNYKINWIKNCTL
jgi:putative endonuclease